MFLLVRYKKENKKQQTSIFLFHFSVLYFMQNLKRKTKKNRYLTHEKYIKAKIKQKQKMPQLIFHSAIFLNFPRITIKKNKNYFRKFPKTNLK